MERVEIKFAWKNFYSLPMYKQKQIKRKFKLQSKRDNLKRA